MPDDIISQIMNNQFLGVPTILIIAVLIGVIIIVYKKKPKQKEYKEINLKKEVKENYKDLFDKLGSDKIKKYLIWGFQRIGRIGRGSLKFYNNEECLILEVYNLKLLGRVKYLLNFKPAYFIIPKKAITETDREYIINPEFKYENYLASINFGKSGEEIANNEPYKLALEQSMKAMLNFIPYQTWLSVQHAQGSESLDHIAEIEKTKRNEMVSEMTGKKVKK